MPKIIRSSGVNIVERARPLVAPLKSRREPDALPAPSAEDRRLEMEKIKASADLIVEEILSKARNDADNMLVDARQETINVLQDAVREGWEQGMSDALQQARALQEAARREIDEALETLREERLNMLREAERGVLELVFDIADKVLSVEMDRGTQWVAAMVREAMRQMEGDESAVMKVAEGAREKVAAVSRKLLESSGKRPGCLTVLADQGLPPGGCIIETDRGAVNNTVEDKADKLKNLLREST